MKSTNKIEEFNELRKQNWQIEALFIGSVLLALFQGSDYIFNNQDSFKNILFIKPISKSFLSYLQVSIFTLLVGFSINLIFRFLWVIKISENYFIDEKNTVELKNLNQYDIIASRYFSISILLFFIALFQVAIFILLYNFIVICVGNFNHDNLLLLIYFPVFCGIGNIVIILSNYPKALRFMNLGELPNNFLSYFGFVFLFRKTLNKYILNDSLYQKENSNLLFLLLNRRVSIFIISTHLLFFPLNYYIIKNSEAQNASLLSSNHYYSEFFNGEICIENEYSDKDYSWLFVKQEMKDQGMLLFDDPIKKDSLFADFANNKFNNLVSVKINNTKITPTWHFMILNGVKGYKSYINTTNLPKGINKIKVKALINKEEKTITIPFIKE